MIRYDWTFRGLAFGYAALAGFVDVIGFLKSGGFFLSFMSGNSTRLAVGLADVSRAALAAAALIALFVIGVTGNALISGASRRLPRKLAASAGVAGLILAAALAQTLGHDLLTIGLLCLAMGAANTIFQRDGDVSIGVTYMTGTLVKLGHRIADALRGGDRTSWLPYLLLWLALVLGGLAGAIGFALSATASLWAAASFALLLAVLVLRLGRDAVQ